MALHELAATRKVSWPYNLSAFFLFNFYVPAQNWIVAQLQIETGTHDDPALQAFSVRSQQNVTPPLRNFANAV